MPQPTVYDDLRIRITHLVESLERAPVVGISGHGGAGKSTLAARLMADLGGQPEQVVRTDRFYAVDAGPGSGLFDLHDWPALLDLLNRLRATPNPRHGSSTPSGPTTAPNARATSPCHRW